MRVNRNSFYGLMAAVTVAWAGAANAQAWPDKPIRYIVPYSAGGVTDMLARVVTEGLKLGQPVVVENKPGQGGALGMAELARSAPDGYTIGGGTLGSHGLNPALYPKLAYDPQKSFVPVVLLAKQPNVLVVSPSLGVNSVQELVKLLKANPGKYSFGSSGNGSSQHIAGEMFKIAAGVDIHGVHDWTTERARGLMNRDRYEQPPDLERALRVAYRSSPVSYLRSWKSPVLLIHGDDDRNVRFGQTVDLVQRLAKAGVPYEELIIPDDTHHFMMHANSVKVDSATAAFLEKRLR